MPGSLSSHIRDRRPLSLTVRWGIYKKENSQAGSHFSIIQLFLVAQEMQVKHTNFQFTHVAQAVEKDKGTQVPGGISSRGAGGRQFKLSV